MDAKEYLAVKAGAGVTLERCELNTKDGPVPDPDNVRVSTQEFDKITGAKKPGRAIEYSISGMKKDRANLVAAIADIDKMLTDLEAA